MRIVFDLQSCQSPGSRSRGIGRYSFSHVHAFIEKAKEHEVILVLNNNFSDAIDLVREDFKDVLPSSNIKVFNATNPLGEQQKDKVARLIYRDFIRSLKPDVFHVTSIFENLHNAVTDISYESSVIDSVTLYDLIPYQYAETYLTDDRLRYWYYGKLQAIKNSDLVLSISNSSRQEAIDLLGINPEKIVNISSAIGDHFKVAPCAEERKLELYKKFGLQGQYILYTGGIDFRKNIDGLISAYAKLPLELRMRYQLAVVCSIDDANRSRLKNLAKMAGIPEDRLVLTGFVTEQELVDLYNMATLFVFPSFHEGFGLPALEAMACGVPTLVSNNSSLPEVVGRHDVQFDSRNPQHIANTIISTLSNPARMQELREHGLQQARLFSWEKTAEVTLQAFEAAVKEKSTHQTLFTPSYTTTNRPLLAFVSLLPPAESGIADYSTELLPALSRYYDIEVITPQIKVTHPWLSFNFTARTLEWFTKHASRYDRVVYQLGNSAQHYKMFELLQRVPGTVVLHDFFLSSALYNIEASGLEENIYGEALWRSHGYKALQDFYADPEASVMRYPANLEVLTNAQGIIVHSEYSRRLAAQFYGDGLSRDWATIPHLRAPKKRIDSQEAKQLLALPESCQVTATFGFIAPTKLHHELLDAWLSLYEHDSNAYLVFVGQNSPKDYGVKITQRIAQSAAAQRIRITGFASADSYNLWLNAADVTVQLRSQSRGESSGALHDCISAAKTLIYNANGSAAELPEGIGYRLADCFTHAQLTQALRDAHQDREQSRTLAQAAYSYSQQLLPNIVAQQYMQAIERFAQQHPLAHQKRLIQSIQRVTDVKNHTDMTETACAITQNTPSLAPPFCYIDITALDESARVSVHTRLADLVMASTTDWRVELVEKIDGYYQIQRQLSCRLNGIKELSNTPLLTCADDAWLHIGQIQADSCIYARLSRVALIDAQQLQQLTPARLINWLTSGTFLWASEVA